MSLPIDYAQLLTDVKGRIQTAQLRATFAVKAGLAQMLKGGVIMDVVTAEQARIAEEAGLFDFSTVAAAICNKMERRHPHIFGELPALEQSRDERWEALKAAERTAVGQTSAMDGVALALPALLRAEKLQKRAARHGFDWPDVDGPAEKVREEMSELATAQTEPDRLEEAGDLLFAAVNLVRAYGAAPEDALRVANLKFERRFRAMEQLAADHGQNFAKLNIEQQENLWIDVKASEPRKTP